MVIVLASKPGLTGASALSIPKDWDATWFRGFINNLLKGGDVRNAVGVNGISVTGTIASPYATISIGGVGVTYPIILNPPAGAYALQINGATFAAIDMNASGATGNTSDFYLFQNTGAAGSGGSFIGTRNANNLNFQTNATTRIQITGAGAISGFGPTANGLVDMSPDFGTFTGTITGCTTSPTGTVVWARMGNLVVLFLTAILGTSNTTSLTMTGLPAVIQPIRAQNLMCLVQDNGTNVAGLAQVTASGTVTFFRDVLATGVFSTTGFTAAGNKGTDNATIAYLLV